MVRKLAKQINYTFQYSRDGHKVIPMHVAMT